jgi:hypothetical protein
MRIDRSKGIRRQVSITVINEGATEVFQSNRGGRLGLAFRAPDAVPLSLFEERSASHRLTEDKTLQEAEARFLSSTYPINKRRPV